MANNCLDLGITEEDFNSYLDAYVNKESVPLEQQKLLWNALTEEDKEILNCRLSYLTKAENCLTKNVEFFKSVFKRSQNCKQIHPINTNFSCLLYLITREWSSECEDELKEWFDPVISEIDDYSTANNDQLKILHIGADLMRLSYCLAEKGLAVDAVTDCVMKYHIITSIFENIRNVIYPYATEFDNVIDLENQIRSIKFPDKLCKKNITDLINIKFNYGNFFHTDSNYDIVITTGYFHLDSNIFQTAKDIYQSLKPNGIWINNGPISLSFKKLYRAQTKYSGYSYEEIIEEIREIGFQIEKSNLDKKTTFCKDDNRMLFEKFNLMFFVVRKVNY